MRLPLVNRLGGQPVLYSVKIFPLGLGQNDLICQLMVDHLILNNNKGLEISTYSLD